MAWSKRYARAAEKHGFMKGDPQNAEKPGIRGERAMRCPYAHCKSSVNGEYPFKTHAELMTHIEKHQTNRSLSEDV